MLPTTANAVREIMRADPTITPPDRNRLLSLLRQGSETTDKPAAATEARIIRRVEAARILARSPRAVDRLATEGALARVKLPGRKRSAGFRYADVVALIGAQA